MAHEVETMAYAGATPWHGLGVKVKDNMSPQEMLVAAGLDWSVSKRPGYIAEKRFVSNITDPTQETKMVRVEDSYYTVRDSDNKILSHCGEGYTPFQNKEVMGFFRKFTENGDMSMDTAGSLREGKDIWGLAKLSSNFRLVNDDEVKGYLLLNNSHQVGKAMTIMFTPIRVVCNNTLTMALSDKNNSRFRVLHVQAFDEEVKRAAEYALGLSGEQMKLFQEQSEFLASKKYSKDTVENFIAKLYQPKLIEERLKVDPATLPPLHSEFKKTAESVYQALETSPGANLSSAKGTWWGALNAVTYTSDYGTASRNAGNNLHSAWFGKNAQVKRKALELATEFAEVA